MKKTILFLVMALALTTSTLFAQVPSYVPTNGLVGYWPFNGNANDISGNGNNGTVNGATLTTDRNGNANSAYSFDGINDYIIANGGDQFATTSRTVSYWIVADPNLYGELICLGSPASTYWGCISANYETRINYGRGCNESGTSLTPQYQIGEWYFVTFSNINETTSNVYINGIQLGQINHSPPSSCSSKANLYFGVDIFSIPEYHNIKLDDITIFNRALTQQEITNLYNSSLPQTACLPANVPTSGLVGYWPFCGNANDDSGNGNNGTVNGATLTTDRFGNANSAYNFDGVDDFIQVPNSNSISITGDITMAAWVNTFGYNNQNYQTILSKRETYWTWEYAMGLSYHTNIVHDTKLIAARALGMGNGQQVWSTNSYIPNSWEYWVATISNGQLKLYKNGVLDNTQPFTLVPNNQNCPLLFGKNTLSDNSEQFLGKIDDIGIWSRALTQEEITNLYNVNQCITNITVTDTLIINVGQLSFNDPVTWANNITIAPNPASSQININFNNITNLNGGTLKIINSLGQQVATTPITTSGTNSTMQLATWGGTGMYFVQIINPQGQIVDIKKIILQ